MSFGPELIWSWSLELSALSGRRVQRADGGGDAVIISFAGSANLLLSWGAQNCGAALIGTADRKCLLDAARRTPPIANAVRSHITGASFTAVRQLNRDRILEFTFIKTLGAGFSVERKLVLEIMERFSNLLMTDEKGVIIETAKHIHTADNSFRTVLPGLPYRMPPRFEGVALEEWLAAPDKESVTKIAGVGRPLLKILAPLEANRAACFLRGLYSESCASLAAQRIGKYITALPALLPDAAPLENESTGTLATLAPMKESSVGNRRKNIIKYIEKEITRRERQLNDIHGLLADSSPARYRLWGELIVSNIWKIRHGATEARLSCRDKEGREVESVVPLDPRLTPSGNASEYFAKYKKITSAQERAAALAGKVEDELADLREELALVQSVEETQVLLMFEEELGMTKASPKKAVGKERRLPPHVRFEFEKAIIVAGLSAKGNRYATFRFAAAEDFWFHVRGVPGSHVILRPKAALGDGEFERLAAFCASLAVFYSKAKDEARHRVDYTRRKYVSPIRGGEANVTYREFSTISGDPSLWSAVAREF